MRISPKLLVFEILAFLVFAVLAGAGYLAWRLSQGPIDLSLIRPQVEHSLSEARGGQPVKIQSLQLEWSGERGRVEAAAKGLTALDKAGHVVFKADRAAIAFDAVSLLSGKFKTRQMRLENGTASVVRSKDGVWSMADIVLMKEPRADHPFDPLKDLDWSTLATPVRALVSAGSFERVELANFQLNVDDQKSGTKWGANPVGGIWTANQDGVTLDLKMKLVGQSEPNTVGIALAADGKVSTATGRLTLQGVDPVTIARIFGYTGDAFVSGKPANATFTVSATEKGGLQKSQVTLSDVNGHGKLGEVELNVSDLTMDAIYDPATRQIDLASLKIASDKATGEFAGSVDMAPLMSGDPGAAIPFKLHGRNFSVSPTPMFEGAWPFVSAEIDASLAPVASRLTIASLKAQTGEAQIAGAGEMWLDGPPEKRLLGVKAKMTADGAVTPQQVLAFWPVNLGSGARGWLHDHVPAGKASKLVFSVDWPPGANSAGFLPNEDLTLDFQVDGATVRYLEDFPPVTDASGTGHLEGNKLSLDIASGKINTWTVDEGKVVLPKFFPHDGVMDITMSGHGDLREVMRVLDASSLKVGSKYGLLIDQMTGTGGAELHVQRPMAEQVADSDIKYSITGGFRGAAAPNLVAGFGLSEADVRYSVTHDDMAVSGAGKFGPAAVVFDWKERFDKPGGEAGRAELSAQAKATPDLLNAFGFAARNMMQGEAAVDLHAAGPGGRDFDEITANVDLTHAQLELPEFGWRKKYDAPAQGSFRYGKDDKTAVLTGDIRSDGLELIGTAKLGDQNALQSADIERIFSRDSVDLRGGVTRKDDGGYRVALNGPYFDASPWMDQILSMGGDDETPIDPAEGGKGPVGPVFDVNLTTDRLKLREGADLTTAKVSLQFDSIGPRDGKVTGLIDKTKKGDVTITALDQGKRRVLIHADDAGFASRVLLKLDYLRGGKVTLDGIFGRGGGSADVTLTDVRLKDAPLLAQLLSIASLRGLADVMSGEGVLFTKIDAPVKLNRGRIELPGLRASGPALGLTARGWISPKQQELSLDGVLVPSFGVNSALGGLPIIGDLFVSRQGEGMFAPTYSVRGTFEQAHIAINPIAALTPGLLRRIFENPDEAPPTAEAAPKPAVPSPAAPKKPAAPAQN